MLKLEFSELRNYLLLNLGLNFNVNQERDLYRMITKASKSFNFDDTHKFINWLINQDLSNKQKGQLAIFLTIGETYFFRDKKAFDYLESEYLPELIRHRSKKKSTKKLKIWSSGCSTGEEPYSIAILLTQVIPDIKNWDITILATDINSESIEKSKKGIYSNWSFRGLPESFKTKYFKKLDNNKLYIHKKIQEMVTFSTHNLVDNSNPFQENNTNDIDIIFCRNVFIYFSKKKMKSIVEKFANSLVNGGILLVSPVEVPFVDSPNLNSVIFKGFTIFIKKHKGISKKFNEKNNEPFSLSKVDKFRQLNGGIILDEKLKFPEIKTVDKIVLETVRISEYQKNVDKKKSIKLLSYEKIQALYKSGFISEAENHIENFLKNQDINTEKYYLLLARIKADKGMLEESEQLCLQAIQTNKINPNAYYFLSTILNEQGKTVEAIKSLNSCIFLDPDFALGHFLLGIISLKAEKKSQSKNHFRNALKCLSKLMPDKKLDDSDNLSVGGLIKIINSIEYKTKN